jgi:hypothetical protein
MKKLLAILAAAGALSIVPMATGDTGTPIGPGGCNMLTPISTPSPMGLDPMMAGSANGNGATNMLQMLGQFSSQPFCGA